MKGRGQDWSQEGGECNSGQAWAHLGEEKVWWKCHDKLCKVMRSFALLPAVLTQWPRAACGNCGLDMQQMAGYRAQELVCWTGSTLLLEPGQGTFSWLPILTPVFLFFCYMWDMLGYVFGLLVQIPLDVPTAPIRWLVFNFWLYCGFHHPADVQPGRPKLVTGSWPPT